MADEQQVGISNTTLLGEMVWLYSLSDLHKNWSIASIHQWLLPAILHKQFRIYHENGKPIGLVTWAWMSKEVEEAYVMNTKSLQPKDWKSGDRLWGIDWIAPHGHTKQMSRDIKHNLFPNEVARFLRAKKASDTLKIFYLHGTNARKKSQNWNQNPTVRLKY